MDDWNKVFLQFMSIKFVHTWFIHDFSITSNKQKLCNSQSAHIYKPLQLAMNQNPMQKYQALLFMPNSLNSCRNKDSITYIANILDSYCHVPPNELVEYNSFTHKHDLHWPSYNYHPYSCIDILSLKVFLTNSHHNISCFKWFLITRFFTKHKFLPWYNLCALWLSMICLTLKTL